MLKFYCKQLLWRVQDWKSIFHRRLWRWRITIGRSWVRICWFARSVSCRTTSPSDCRVYTRSARRVSSTTPKSTQSRRTTTPVSVSSVLSATRYATQSTVTTHDSHNPFNHSKWSVTHGVIRGTIPDEKFYIINTEFVLNGLNLKAPLNPPNLKAECSQLWRPWVEKYTRVYCPPVERRSTPPRTEPLKVINCCRNNSNNSEFI